MNSQQKSKAHMALDPNKLPWSVPKAKVRAPAEDAAAYQRLSRTFGVQPLQVAGAIPAGAALATIPALPATPTAADLAETEEIQLTPAIRAKAKELGNNPVKIYNWVRNNIQFLPTYGSIQGAELTLLNKRGNAFDTASLLIALLRASGTSARYAYGTIQLPAEQVMNWVGGVKNAQAAQKLLGQGGIPNIGQTVGGTVKFIKMEHVWVEAFVDYVPSRGAVNKKPNTWVPLDASFKQYTYKAGMDLQQNVPFDGKGLADQLKAGATINEAEGWVQNVNQTALQNSLSSYQAQLKTYIDSQKANATVGDVLGSQQVVIANPSILFGTLPYKTLAEAGKFSALPDSFRHKFQYKLFASDFDLANDSPIIALEQSLPRLAGKKITLSFTPATQADTDTLNSYLPKPHADGTPIQPSELPASLPGYLINLKAELRIDGQIIASGGSFKLGSDLSSQGALYDPVSQNWDAGEVAHPAAGEYIAIGLDLAGVSSSQLNKIKAKLEKTKSKLEAKQYGGLTKDDLIGDLLHSAIIGYFSTIGTQASLAAQTSNSVRYALPSYGYFQTSAKTEYWFGIPKKVSFPNLIIDVKHWKNIIESNDADITKRINFSQQIGTIASANEHLIPEKIFSSNGSTNEAVSAIKALSVAAIEGQKIYTIHAGNLNSTIEKLTVSTDVKYEITNAANTGKRITISQGNVSINGWTGVGYIIFDPETGSGAYKISGGANGGSIPDIMNGISSAALAVSDNLSSGSLDYRILFSDSVIYQQTLARASSLVGWAGLFIQTGLILSDESLSIDQIIGQISINVLANMITAYLIGSLVAAGLIGGLPAIAFALIIGFTLSIASTLISKLYFSLLRQRMKIYAEQPNSNYIYSHMPPIINLPNATYRHNVV
ncbi:transglutaminase-like domain-containing protein [Deefgea piscis]|uniref:transglutaminase-like domain-containing protein n=1 Tax=Deefgea piscis TaxID=2739061 RepID=UPI001C7FD285|nr:transglutaminase-like domain-containing protein [Deefgea piscis]QZA80713.1 transglutaminase-like domain-containing protein [Deefgea piscis]